MRKASCARPTSTSGRGFRASTRYRGSIRTSPRIDPNIANLPGRIRPAATPIATAAANARIKPVSSAEWRRQRRFIGQKQERTTARAATLPQTVLNSRTIASEIVAEIDGSLSDAQADELARHHRLERIGSQNFPLIGGTIGLFRITDRRTVETVSRELAADASVRSVQPNFRYLLQDQKPASTEGDPAQYALAETSIARGAYAGPWRQRHHRRDRFRNRHQTSGTCQCDCGQL